MSSSNNKRRSLLFLGSDTSLLCVCVDRWLHLNSWECVVICHYVCTDVIFHYSWKQDGALEFVFFFMKALYCKVMTSCSLKAHSTEEFNTTAKIKVTIWRINLNNVSRYGRIKNLPSCIHHLIFIKYWRARWDERSHFLSHKIKALLVLENRPTLIIPERGAVNHSTCSGVGVLQVHASDEGSRSGTPDMWRKRRRRGYSGVRLQGEVRCFASPEPYVPNVLKTLLSTKYLVSALPACFICFLHEWRPCSGFLQRAEFIIPSVTARINKAAADHHTTQTPMSDCWCDVHLWNAVLVYTGVVGLKPSTKLSFCLINRTVLEQWVKVWTEIRLRGFELKQAGKPCNGEVLITLFS